MSKREPISPGAAETPRKAEALYGLTPALVAAFTSAVEGGDVARIRRLAEPIHAADQADLLERLTPEQRSIAVRALGPELDPELLTHLNDEVRDEIVEQMSPKEVAAALSELEVDDQVAVIEGLDEPAQREILEAIPTEERVEIEEALTYPEASAARLMQRDVIAVPTYWTVGQIIDHMREQAAELPESFYDIFVVNPKHEPVGTIGLSTLLRNKRPVVVRTIMNTDIKVIPADMDREEVAYLFDQYDLVSAPVVERNGRLIGVITIDDIVDVIREEAEEDILHMGGVADTARYAGVLSTSRGRLPWLFVNLATAFLAAAVIGQFKETIAQVVALAVLMPICASMAGNAGMQTVTVTIRSLALKELTAANALRIFVKECLVGGINGFVFALVVGLAAGLWFGNLKIGLIIAGAMVINMLNAGISGILTPLAFNRLKLDPAPASGVFLTAMTDVVGYASFLGLATLFLI